VIESINAHDWVLANGIRVVAKQTDFKSDQILMTAFSPGGTDTLDLKKLKTTIGSASAIPLGGLGELDGVDVEKALAGRQASVSAWINRRYEGFSGASTVDDLETMLQLVHLNFMAPREDAKRYKVWKDTKKKSVEMAGNAPKERYLRKARDFMHLNDGRYFELDTTQKVEALSYKDSYGFFRERFQDTDFVFTFVGSFDPKVLKSFVLQYLGSLPSTERRESTTPSTYEYKSARRLAVKEGLDQRADFSISYIKSIEPSLASDFKTQKAARIFADA
jgi:zinc protease